MISQCRGFSFFRLLLNISAVIVLLLGLLLCWCLVFIPSDAALLQQEEKVREQFRISKNQQQVKQARELISSGEDINKRDGAGQTLLDRVAEQGNAEAAKIILHCGLEFEFTRPYDYNTLHSACIGGSTEIIDMLLQAGVPLEGKTARGFTPMTLAVLYGQADAVEFLIKKGATIDYHRSNIGALLAFSAENSRLDAYWNSDVIKVLLRYGADPNEFGRHVTYSALHLISRDDYYEARDDYYRSTLHKRILNSQYEAAKSLISAGANVNLRYGTSDTPLHLAAKRGRTRLVELFLSNGADKNIKTGDNKTARDLAIEAGHKDIAKLLK